MTNRGRNVRYTDYRSESPIDNQTLQRIAPSVFATEPWCEMSSKYTFIPTSVVVDKLRSEGFFPFYVGQGRTRIPGKQDFTKHLLRFRHAGYQSPIEGLVPEIVLVNAHDGLSAWKMLGGLLRYACMNGLLVGDTYNQISVTHRGNVDGIVEASYEIVDQFPQVMEQVREFSGLRLAPIEQEKFATSALILRYGDAESSPITPASLVVPKRSADADPTLWHTFNTVQEKLITGGVRGQDPVTGRRAKSRKITSIGENTRLNKALWSLTEAMAKIKQEQAEPALVLGA